VKDNNVTIVALYPSKKIHNDKFIWLILDLYESTKPQEDVNQGDYGLGPTILDFELANDG
jgi:hypothetical protein